MALQIISEQIIRFLSSLKAPRLSQKHIRVMNPYRSREVRLHVESFYRRFYSDKVDRVYLFGINPGRFGSGITGITFTDPVALEQFCGIPNGFEKRRELSSEFIYEVIEKFGGVERFFSSFFLTAVSPLGLLKEGVNFNYYDDASMMGELLPFISRTIVRQVNIGGNRRVAIVLGTGKNRLFFEKLNRELRLFRQTVYLEHPRFIMQYRRRAKKAYIEKYVNVLTRSLAF